MKILYLCDRRQYVSKMSRVRFHSMEAISSLCDLRWSGPNWGGYDVDRSVQENIDSIYRGQDKPDLVIGYKPLDLIDFSGIESKKCIRYNEMYDELWTRKEIDKSGADIVICHHLNDMNHYKENIYDGNRVRFINIPHSAERTIFKDMRLDKKIDLMLVGSIFYNSMLGKHYPLRERMVGVLQKMSSKHECRIYPHPGGDHLDAYTGVYTRQFAHAINSSKICVTCSGAPRSRFGKYVEVPMCGTAIAGDLPGEQRDEISKFLIEIDLDMHDNEIMEKLSFYIDNNKEREKLTSLGLEWSKKYTQEEYARRFIEGIKNEI